MKSWYAVYTQAQREHVAQHHLHNQGFDVYLPQISRQVRHARKIRSTRTPLFPRYLFISLDHEEQRWRSINGTIGVIGILSDDVEPVRIPSGVIEKLGALAGKDGLIKPIQAFEKGQCVRVESGPLCDLEGLFECVDARNQVTLLMNLIGGGVRVNVGSCDVTAV